MITRMIPQVEVPPPEAAVSAKCHNCMIEYFANVSDMKVEKTLSPTGKAWFWITDCPKCHIKIVFDEVFAEVLKDE